MSQRVERFCGQLQDRLNQMENRVESARQKIQWAPHQAADAVASQASRLRAQVDQDRTSIEHARDMVQHWQTQEKENLRHLFAQWRASRQYDRLEAKAQEAEAYADASMDLALSAINEAGAATLEAIAVRQEAENAQKPLPRK